ncbi:Histone-fold [Penicillium cinerascens]|uniref:Histone-fold n=1 Tax=Penicillium cinerascens TaxID=70096 RepID=A0A9W9T0N1_9EURO|nr:Histone-fold [Penicillium cinerascens]KAJ5205007.1 Histone-fold [Penicillium cinerascens]
MAGEPQPAKKRRLPFKPPSRTPSTSAGPSSSASKAAPKGKAKQNTAKASSSASAPKSANRKSTSSAKRPRAESPPASASASDGASDSDSEASSRSRERSLSEEPDYILAEIITNNQTEDVASSDPKIPPKLLTRLLHHHFQNEKTKVAKDANEVVAKYVDVFVREAIARAAYERAETDGAGGGRSIGDGFLEVEDLEKMAPQLTMDF